VGKCIVGI
jgi:hypothetical protein